MIKFLVKRFSFALYGLFYHYGHIPRVILYKYAYFKETLKSTKSTWFASNLPSPYEEPFFGFRYSYVTFFIQ